MKELVGQGKPFYSAIDKAAGLLKRKVGTGAEFMQELKGLGGIKQSEIEDRKLGEIMGMPRMTHDQFMANLSIRPAPKIQEKVLDVENSDGDRFATREELAYPPEGLTQHDVYTLHGGKNYREMLIKAPAGVDNQEKIMEMEAKARRMPMIDSTPEQQAELTNLFSQINQLKAQEKEQKEKEFKGVPHHFKGEPNILASMRLKDRIVEQPPEIRHVAFNKKSGFPSPDFATPEELDAYIKTLPANIQDSLVKKQAQIAKPPLKLLHLEELQSDWHQQGREYGYKEPQKPAVRTEANPFAFDSIQDTRAVPDAPFKKNWEEMALKRLIHHAAEKGYHGIVVTPGQEQADRYGLSKQIDSLELFPSLSSDKQKPFRLRGHKNNKAIISRDVDESDLPELIGDDLAERLLSSPENHIGTKKLSGVDLETDKRAKGMKTFYDTKVPNILNSIGKKYGVITQIGGHKILGDPLKRAEASERLGLAGERLADMNPEQVQAFNQKLDESNAVNLHHFPITEEMRKDVLTNGLPLHKEGGIIHKAVGGTVQPSINQMRAELLGKKPISLSDLSTIGANEAPNMNVKAYIPPSGGQLPVGGVSMGNQPLPIGGIDMSQQQGHQLMPANLVPPQGAPQGQPPQAGGMPSPLSAGASSPAQQPPSNILQMTPQGQALNAMSPPQAPARMSDGGSIPMTYKVGGSDNMPEAQPSWYQDDGESTFNIDNLQQLAKGGDVESMKKELAAKKAPMEEGKRMLIEGEGKGGVKGIMVPRHMWHGKQGVYKKGDKKGQKFTIAGMSEINKARAKVYGAENRDPLNIGQIGKIHKDTLADHFAKSPEEQHEAEEAALNRLRQAKHIGHDSNTLDESEKLDTVRHETDSQGRTHVGFASKGVAGHALYTSGYGQNQKHHIINTCPGQTVGCGGGVDEKGIVDTKKGTCFAPNAESQYVHAAIRRAAHEQAKHDPAMTRDWILAHTGSLRDAARLADKNNKRLLFRPNVVDETDTSSRHVLRHLNDQRKAVGKPDIIANSYGKTNELHDPENGYHVTHSNVGPKVKKSESIAENIGRDKARVRNTIMAADNKGDFVNEQGNKTPPKGSYLVTDVKRDSPMSKKMEENITHAKYWTTGREDHELTPEEKAEGPEGHFGGNGKPTTPDKAHFGHTTIKGQRFDYQKQHILHPRLVQVGHNDDGTPHMIPTDSRFMDTKFLPEKRFKTKNGKEAGHILMTTPTESTDKLGHQTSFTHHVGPAHIEHAVANKGEYEIDKPEDQIKSANKEYVAPQPIKIVRKAHGGLIGGRHHGFSDDDFHAFPERNIVAQRHLAMRDGEQEEQRANQMTYHSKHKKPVSINKKLDTMLLELTMKKAK